MPSKTAELLEFFNHCVNANSSRSKMFQNGRQLGIVTSNKLLSEGAVLSIVSSFGQHQQTNKLKDELFPHTDHGLANEPAAIVPITLAVADNEDGHNIARLSLS